MDQRYKGTLDIDSQSLGKRSTMPLQFAPIESYVPQAVEASIHHQAFLSPADTNNYFLHPASVTPVEGIPLVPSLISTVDAGIMSRPDFYVSQANVPSDGVYILNSRPLKQDAMFLSAHSSRDDDRLSNLSEDAPSARVKLLCSYAGKIMPRPSDGRLRYVGGETRMITVNRDINFSSVMVKMVEIQPQTVSIKYQLPDEDLDALVSVSSEEDLENMMEEYDKLEAGEHPRLRVFLFTAADYDVPSATDVFGDAKNSEQQYLDAVNGLSEGAGRKLSDASTQSAASSMNGLGGLAASQTAVYVQDQRQALQFITQAPTQLLPLVPDPLQPSSRSEQEGSPASVWSSEVPNLNSSTTPYAAVGVPLQTTNGPYQSNLSPAYTSDVVVHADGTLLGGHHVLVPNQNGPGYTIFSNASVITEPLQSDPVTSYEYDKAPAQKPLDPLYTTTDVPTVSASLGLNGKLTQPVVAVDQQEWNVGPGWEQSFSPPVLDVEVPTGTGPRDNPFRPNAGIDELSAWSTGTTVGGEGPSSSNPLSVQVPNEPELSKPQLSDTLVNFLEDSLHVTSTSVESCTAQMPLSGNSSNNMPLDLLTNDDFGRASCNSTGSNLPSSAASSSSYVLDNAAALSESPSKFLDNLNTGLLFPEDTPEKKSGLQSSSSAKATKDSYPSFAFAANDVESKEVTDVGGGDSQDERLQETCDRSFDTSDLHSVKQTEPAERPIDNDSFESRLPDVPDITPDSEDSTGNAAETEAIARARGLQVIRHSDLEEVRELGSGTFGTVYHGKWRGSDVAIKRIKSSCFFGPPSEQGRLKDDFWSEACILARLHHPNVVAFYGVVPDSPGSTLATVTEFMVNGSLKQVLQRKDSIKALDRRRRLLIAMDAAFGMEYLHDKKIIHFDLKGENLLVNMRDPHRPVCKVGDLGLSKIKHKTMVSGGVRGTLPWMAPELLNGKSILVSEKVDVFSFGIVMWELLTGEEPYADLHYGAIIGGILSSGLRPPIPSYCEPEWKSLMERCWADDPAERPTFSEITNELRSMMTALVSKMQAQNQQQQQQQ